MDFTFEIGRSNRKCLCKSFRVKPQQTDLHGKFTDMMEFKQTFRFDTK